MCICGVNVIKAKQIFWRGYIFRDGVEFWPRPCQAPVNLKYTQRCNDGIRSYPRSLFMILGLSFNVQYSPQDVEVLYSPQRYIIIMAHC